MAKMHMKRCSTSLIIRELQMETTMRYHIIPDRVPIIKKSAKNKFSRGCAGKKKKKNFHTLGENVICYNRYREEYGGSLKTKIRSTMCTDSVASVMPSSL